MLPKFCIVRYLSLAFLLVFASTCTHQKARQSSNEICKNQGIEVPEWARKAPIYQVNIRQFTPEGTINAFSKHLPRLAEMNVKILWIMPVQPIGKLNRKGPLGSYYSIADYRSVHQDYGTLDDFRNMVIEAHRLGMRVILDWVANHTAWDHPWIETHPEWYKKDENGRIVPPIPDWSDVAQLDYSNAELREAMKNEMKFWIFETDIDGFRCDVAEMVPGGFWSNTFRELNQIKPLYLLAEAEGVEMHENFHATYGWHLHHIMNKIAKGDTTAEAIDSYLETQNKEGYRSNMQRMYFTSNHDENSWNGTEFERLGPLHQAMFVTMAFLPNAVPMIYTGQESALNRRLKFFDRDPVDWADFPLMDFYKKIFELYTTHPAVTAACPTGDFLRLDNGPYPNLYVYMRAKDDKKVLVIANMEKETVTLPELELIFGEWTDLFTGKKKTIKAGTEIALGSGEYLVLYI
ncbi:alpha-amylase family glycosyl hydrolase [Schleiferia thermophila]|jgi:hypothetical protein|uniref:Glycosidase n=1 Tax=Schleiferia thermophila TaxID=884107 RepID=A0A368ZYM4_9FLAO|nr:alpha-amylase family glycosyl hydrolase [Schleiferia thermophila]RCX02130.1 glycosidase [Schleiferia thermophila]